MSARKDDAPFLLIWTDDAGDVMVQRFALRSLRDAEYRKVKEYARSAIAGLAEFETTDTMERVSASVDQ